MAIEAGTDSTAWGAVVPDLPGCFSAGDTEEEAIANAVEAIGAYCELLAEDGRDIPVPQPLSEQLATVEFDGWIWSVAEVNLKKFKCQGQDQLDERQHPENCGCPLSRA